MPALHAEVPKLDSLLWLGLKLPTGQILRVSSDTQVMGSRHSCGGNLDWVPSCWPSPSCCEQWEENQQTRSQCSCSPQPSHPLLPPASSSLFKWLIYQMSTSSCELSTQILWSRAQGGKGCLVLRICSSSQAVDMCPQRDISTANISNPLYLCLSAHLTMPLKKRNS